MNPVAMPQLGETIRGRYRITGKLGEGGMGVVFQALELTRNYRVAIKVLRPDMLDDPENVARFDRESRAVSALKGPHIARVLDVDFTDGGLPFIVMELLEGHDLATEIELRGRIEPDEAVEYVLQACNAMAEAHALGIIHRDLKPSNLFICDTGGARMVKVLDFGISKIVNDNEVRMTKTQSSFGTPLYMSPEQVRSVKNVDARTDVWSLGVILYELLVGRPPFLGSTTAAAAAIVTEEPPAPRGIRRDLPVGLEDVVLTALEKDARKRYPDVLSFARALLPFAPETGPISGGRLAALQREAESNRVIRAIPSSSDSPTVLRPSRIPEIANARRRRAQAPRQGLVIALAAAIPVGLVAAAALGFSAYQANAAKNANAVSLPPDTTPQTEPQASATTNDALPPDFRAPAAPAVTAPADAVPPAATLGSDGGAPMATPMPAETPKSTPAVPHSAPRHAPPESAPAASRNPTYL